MADKYDVEIIGQDDKDRMLRGLAARKIYDRKANIHGMCIELLTDEKDFKEMWEDNFYYMSDDVRPHGRIVAISDDSRKFRVLYEPVSKTCFIMNTDYYGWVKSIALAVAADFLEEYISIHSRFSVHGSCIDFSGRGIAMIAPSGTGKTTHSFGLLLMDGAKLVSDDWFFVKMSKDDVVAYASERNSYIREDIGKDYKIFESLVKDTKLDKKGRGIANLEDVLGAFKRRQLTVVSKVIILKRDRSDSNIVRKLSVDEAMEYLVSTGFCNPHQLVTDPRKHALRKEFFASMLSKVDIYMVNTTEAVDTVQNEIRKLTADM